MPGMVKVVKISILFCTALYIHVGDDKYKYQERIMNGGEHIKERRSAKRTCG